MKTKSVNRSLMLQCSLRMHWVHQRDIFASLRLCVSLNRTAHQAVEECHWGQAGMARTEGPDSKLDACHADTVFLSPRHQATPTRMRLNGLCFSPLCLRGSVRNKCMQWTRFSPLSERHSGMTPFRHVLSLACYRSTRSVPLLRMRARRPAY